MRKEYWYALIAVAALILLLAYFRRGAIEKAPSSGPGQSPPGGSSREEPGKPAGTPGRAAGTVGRAADR